MRQILINVEEKNYEFFKELVSKLNFVEVEEVRKLSKKEVLQSIEQGFKEAQLIKKGKLAKKPIEKLLNEL